MVEHRSPKALAGVRISPPLPYGHVAQRVEHQTENLGVAGAVPAVTTISPYSTIGQCRGLLSRLSGSESLWGGQWRCSSVG